MFLKTKNQRIHICISLVGRSRKEKKKNLFFFVFFINSETHPPNYSLLSKSQGFSFPSWCCCFGSKIEKSSLKEARFIG
jgi:hypothetical protein